MLTPSITAISFKSVTYGYHDGSQIKPVLEKASFNISQGDCVALLGASGAGKSTILNLVSGIDVPEKGEILVSNKNVTTLGEPKLTLFRREHIGFVYQFFNLVPLLTVAENLAFPLSLNGVDRSTQTDKVEAWLEKIQLADRGAAFPDQLSGGEQQRVAIARALIHSPDIILADEPTGNLDAVHGRNILTLLLQSAREAGKTLLMVTHSREVAESADKVMRLETGKIETVETASGW